MFQKPIKIVLDNVNYNIYKKIYDKIFYKKEISYYGDLRFLELNNKLNLILNDFLPNFNYPLKYNNVPEIYSTDGDKIIIYFDNKKQILYCALYSSQNINDINKIFKSIYIKKIYHNNVISLIVIYNLNTIEFLYDIQRSVRDPNYLFNDYIFNIININTTIERNIYDNYIINNISFDIFVSFIEDSENFIINYNDISDDYINNEKTCVIIKPFGYYYCINMEGAINY